MSKYTLWEFQIRFAQREKQDLQKRIEGLNKYRDLKRPDINPFYFYEPLSSGQDLDWVYITQQIEAIKTQIYWIDRRISHIEKLIKEEKYVTR